MRMAVVDAREVRMLVRQRRVPVPVRMRFVAGPLEIVFVLVTLGEVQPHPGRAG